MFQIDVSVNAPEAGTVKEYLASEEDTVIVGQDLVKLELGGSPKDGEKQTAGQEPKEPASQEQPSSSDPEPKDRNGENEKESTPPSAPPQNESQFQDQAEPRNQPKAEQSKPSPPSTKQSSKPSEPQQPQPTFAYGSREERRVRNMFQRSCKCLLMPVKGQDEPHALADFRAPQTVSKYCSISDYIQ